MSVILYPHSQTIRNYIWGLLQGQIDFHRVFYMMISMWICLLHIHMNCSRNVHFKNTFSFLYWPNICASLEYLFFGKNMIVDDSLFFKALFLHHRRVSFTFVFLIPFMCAPVPVACCTLCLGFVCSHKIIYKHKCLQ